MWEIEDYELWKEYCKNIYIQLNRTPFGYMLTDEKRQVRVESEKNILETAIKMKVLRDLEDKLLWEKDPHLKRKLAQKVYYGRCSLMVE